MSVPRARESDHGYEQKYRTLFDSVLHGILHFDAHGGLIDANRAAERILGLRLEDLRLRGTTKPKWRAVRSDGTPFPAAEQPAHRALATGQPVENVVMGVVNLETNRTTWIEATAAPLFISGSPAADEVCVVFNDITARRAEEDARAALAEERRRADEERARSEARIRSLFELPLIGIAITSPTKGWLEVNEHLCQMFGYSREELSTCTWAELTHPEDLAKDVAEFERVLRGESDGYSIEKRYLHRTGRVLETELAVRCVRTPAGTVDYFIALIQDITERKRLEASEALLYQVQKMESVGRLAGGVAHDFNNMLGVILGHVDLALEQVRPDHPLYEDLSGIKSAAKRSAELTRQLLAFARKQTIAPKVVHLDETVDRISSMLQRLIGEHIELRWRPSRDLWPVSADPSQLDQILTNLCVNARDAIDGTGTITIEASNRTYDEDYCAAHRDHLAGEWVRLAITDTGRGIEPATIPHLFEPFYTTKAMGRGTGLGLAMVYGALKQNGGFVTVTTTLGHGTTFAIHLPRHHAPHAQGTQDLATAEALEGHETILLVEDEPGILAIARRMLEQQGYAVLSAGSPADALRKAGAHPGPIHVLITDVVMPEMNGRELADRVRQLHPETGCLFMSGYTADVIAPHGVLEDELRFLQKPFSRQTLTRKLREVLGRG